MKFISCHIMPLVINILGRRHTHTCTHTHTQTRILMIRTGSILGNLVCASLWPACAWFKNSVWSAFGSINKIKATKQWKWILNDLIKFLTSTFDNKHGTRAASVRSLLKLHAITSYPFISKHFSLIFQSPVHMPLALYMNGLITTRVFICIQITSAV